MSQSEHEHVSRRALLAGAGAVAGGVLGSGVEGRPATAGETATAGGPGAVRIRPADPRYDSLLRGNNFRFAGRPDEIRVVDSTEQVVRAVTEAARAGRRIAARSGGHCFENFTADPAVRTLMDLSAMDDVGYDRGMRAFSVGPGATLGRVYKALFKGWGVTIPGGGCPGVGAGGHFAGGGYGPLSRRYGSVVDHLYAVEVVVADRRGAARAVVATRDPDDPHHDLWWAHTGGGGGNFGVVTRYWLRTPGAAGDPSRLLPPAPQNMLECVAVWSWDGMTEAAFTTLVRNYGTWHERNSAPGSPGTGVYGIFLLLNRSNGVFSLVAQIDAGLPGADALGTDFLTAVGAGAGVDPVFTGRTTSPWLHKLTWPGTGEPGDATNRRYKIKAGYFRRTPTDRQLAAIYRHLSEPAGGAGTGMLLIGYGGQVNTVPPSATAVAQRGTIMKAIYQTVWADAAGDAANLAWVRGFYRDVYAQTGGVPVPGEVDDGSYINYPDADLADPVWNTSGVPASTLYYQDNYPRLQRIKARWDPYGLFRHALSVESPR